MANRGPSRPTPSSTVGKRAARKSRRVDLALIFHIAALAWYSFVWFWHLTPAASKLPGASGWGWFFRYLTFYSFSWQLLCWLLCVASALVTALRARAALAAWADDLACALFGLANVVTIMFYVLEATTKDTVEGGHIQRPPWLGFAVHLANAGAAWADMLLAARRSFSTRASRLSAGLIAAYIALILMAARANGAFPYPFLNKLPWPQGFIGVTIVSQLLFVLLFTLGGRLRRLLRPGAARGR